MSQPLRVQLLRLSFNPKLERSRRFSYLSLNFEGDFPLIVESQQGEALLKKSQDLIRAAEEEIHVLVILDGLFVDPRCIFSIGRQTGDRDEKCLLCEDEIKLVVVFGGRKLAYWLVHY